MSKGSSQRTRFVSLLESDLRYDMAFGTIEKKRIAAQKLLELGLITQIPKELIEQQ